MIDTGPGHGEINRSAAPRQSSHDFSLVRGFQVIGADQYSKGQTVGGDEPWREAVRLEFETRAARFHHAVDSAIVLSNDSVIRWLGDPVARLSLGSNTLTPGVVILADEALPAAAREIVRGRIELWLAATIRRILAPLLALDALQEGSEAVRDLASMLTNSFGILEREPIRAQLKGLSQSDRAELRKLGVRFGAYYVFLPALIKPAARTLALQLWSLQVPGDAATPLAALTPVASSGRTSLLFDQEISREGYCVAGYRPCGERVVRVDVIERLADMIRGAIMESRARAVLGPAGHARTNGFVVNGQMTSLTGCAGDQFASILRSIGFRAVEMKRSEFLGSQPAVKSPQLHEPRSAAESRELAADGQSSAATGGEAESPLESLSTVPKAASLNVVQPKIPPDDGLSAEVTKSDPGAASALAPVMAASPEAEKTELVVVWRPDKSAFSPRTGRDKTWQIRDQAPNRDRSVAGPVDPLDSAGRSAAAEPGRNRNAHRKPHLDLPAAEGGKAAAHPPGGADGHRIARYNKKHRQSPSGRDMSPSHPASERHERAKIDPNSPFAKLLELRPLLEGQANKRP